MEWKNKLFLLPHFTQTFKHPGGTCGPDILRAEIILDSKRDSIQRTFGHT